MHGEKKYNRPLLQRKCWEKNLVFLHGSIFFRKMYRAVSYKWMCLNLLISHKKYVFILFSHFQSYTRNLQSLQELTIQAPKQWFSVWENTKIQALSVTYWPLWFFSCKEGKDVLCTACPPFTVKPLVSTHQGC